MLGLDALASAAYGPEAALTILLPLGAFVAFVVSRTVGLPNGADDIGNWWEPLGLASLFVEGALVVLAAAVLSAEGWVVQLAQPRLQRSYQ